MSRALRVIWLGLALSGCGSAGTLAGTVSVAGGSGAGVAVSVEGNDLARVAVADAAGAFSFHALPDGPYVVRATVPGAELETQSAVATVKGGQADPVTLSFVVRAVQAGTVKGAVHVAGGSGAGVVVSVEGNDVAQLAVANSEGAFAFKGLADGTYLLRATVLGAEVETQSAIATLQAGNADAVTLSFIVPAGSVAGKVAFADGSSAAGLAVSLSGARPQVAAASADGSFRFTSVPSGAGVVSVEVLDTREKRVSASAVVLGGPIDVGTLTLTPVSPVSGTVVLGATPVAGAAVVLSGTELSAVSDAQGHFAFSAVPVGAASFVASLASPPRRGSAQLTVVRGSPGTASIALTEQDVATLSGQVTYVASAPSDGIVVSVPGTAASTTVSADGRYQLSLPEGAWDVVATAQFFPTQTLGHVVVHAGDNLSLPATALSWFEPIWKSQVALSSASVVATAGEWVLLAADSQLLLFSKKTHQVKLERTAGTLVTLSPSGAFMAIATDSTVSLVDTATGLTRNMGTATGVPVDVLFFSSDEGTLYVRGVAGGIGGAPPMYLLERFTLATSTLTTFPADLTANEVLFSADRALVRTGTDVMLVTPTSSIAKVFTDVVSLSVSPVVSAASACVSQTSCTVRVLPSNGTTPLSLGTGLVPTQAPVSAHYGLFSFGGSAATLLVRSTDGAISSWPENPGSVFSSDESRVAYVTAGTANSLHEEAAPPTGGGVVDTDPLRHKFSYVTPTRLFATARALAKPGRVLEVKAGVATTLSTSAKVSTLWRSGWAWLDADGWWVAEGEGAVIPLPEPEFVSFGAAQPDVGVDDTQALSFNRPYYWLLRPGEARAVDGFASTIHAFADTRAVQTQRGNHGVLVLTQGSLVIDLEGSTASQGVVFARAVGDTVYLGWPR